MPTVLYKRATFVTHLPVEHLFTHSHSWLSRVPGTDHNWRAGYTKFALRMLGEIVDVQIECRSGEEISPGDILGSIEGFKAISDIFCSGRGEFVQANPALASSLEAVETKPYVEGWIYEFKGEPESGILDVNGYRKLLDATIDRMLQKQGESRAQHE